MFVHYLDINTSFSRLEEAVIEEILQACVCMSEQMPYVKITIQVNKHRVRFTWSALPDEQLWGN